MSNRGSIFAEEAYALNKMLQHDSWQKGERRLPRLITGSDIDVPGVTATFDNMGLIIFCELHRGRTTWSSLRQGQRVLYESLIRNTAHCSVLCCHDIGPEHGRKIDTRHDIQTFEIMVHDFEIVKAKIVEGNQHWQDFVFKWLESAPNARFIRRKILANSMAKEMS
jgi:hypothetical protein